MTSRPVYNFASFTIAGIPRVLNETAVTDLDILCFYAGSDLFASQDRQRITAAFDEVNNQYHTALSCGDGQIITQTGLTIKFGAGPITALDRVSVNSEGKVAFVAFYQDGSSEAQIGSGPNELIPVTLLASSTRNFMGTGINDASPPIVAIRDRASGSPPQFFVRKWNRTTEDPFIGSTLVGRSTSQIGGICTGGLRGGQTCFTSSDCMSVPAPGQLPTFFACQFPPTSLFDSATSFLDVNDSGLVVFVGLTSDSTQTAVLAGHTVDDLGFVQIFPAGVSPLVRPQLSDTDEAVYRDDVGNIVVQKIISGGGSPLISSGTIAVPAPAVSAGQPPALGQMPGISSDGRWIAFTGTLAGQMPGVYLLNRGMAGIPQKIADTGGDPATPTGRFTQFTQTARAAVSATQRGDGGANITVVFAGERTYTEPGSNAPVTRQGIFRVRATLDAEGTFSPQPLETVIQLGDALSNGTTLTGFDLWDPLSDNGRYIALLAVQSDGGRAIVRVH